MGRAARGPSGRLVDDQVGEKLTPELVVVVLVGLDDISIERSRHVVAAARAKSNELVVADDGERLARELSGGDALDGGRQRLEVREHRRARERIEASRLDAELSEALCNEAIVLRLVAGLPCERELDVDVGSPGTELEFAL